VTLTTKFQTVLSSFVDARWTKNIQYFTLPLEPTCVIFENVQLCATTTVLLVADNSEMFINETIYIFNQFSR